MYMYMAQMYISLGVKETGDMWVIKQNNTNGVHLCV